MAEMNDEGRLVAEISPGQPIAFNTSMNDIIAPEEDDMPPVDDVTPPVNEPEDSPAPPVAEEDDAPPAPPIEEEDEDPFEGYSQAALATEALKRIRPDLIDGDIDKEMDWVEFVDKIDGYLGNTLQAGQQHLVNQTGEIQEYVEFLMSGGDPRVVETALKDVHYSKMDLEEASEEQKIGVIKAMYKEKQLGDEEIDSLVEGFKLSGKVDDMAASAVKLFDAKEKDIMKAAKLQRERDELAAKKQREELTSSINGIIDSGDVLGLSLSDNEKQELKDAFFNPTEIIEVPDGKGGTVARRFTKYQVLENEFKNDLKQQIAFAKLLLDGFKFDKVKEQGKAEGAKDIFAALDRGSGTRRVRKGYNAYLD